MLTDHVREGEEAYEFTWVGKKAAIVEANRPIRKTLRPCPEESKDWDTTQNLYIEGDNLEALKLLQESYLGKVKLIYIDPPYNTGSDNFVYPDNFVMSADEYEKQSGLYDFDGNRMFAENNTGNRRFHSDWCSMIYSRLLRAKSFLAPDGVICIQIDDSEYTNLKKISDEIFGINNFMTTIVVKMSEPTGMKMTHADKRIPKLKEYILVYTGGGKLRLGRVDVPKDQWDKEYKTFLENLSEDDCKILKDIRDNENRTQEDIKRCDSILSGVTYLPLGEAYKKYQVTEKECEAFNFENSWRIIRTVSMAGGAKKIADKKKNETTATSFSIVTPENKMYFIKGDYSSSVEQPRIKLLFANDYLTVNPCDFWQDIKTTGLDNEGFVDFRNGKKPLKLIGRLITLFSPNDKDIIMDFFAGSGTTAEAVMRYNDVHNTHKRFVLVQLPEDLDQEVKKQTGDKKKETRALISFLDTVKRPHLLSEVGKERILRAGDNIENTMIDKGFRVLKIDSSNMNDVYYSAEDLTQDLVAQAADNIKSDRSDLDLLFGCLVDWGVELSLPYTSETLDGCTVHDYADGALIACFDRDVPESVIRAIAERQPERVVFRDSSFADSPAKINVFEIFKLLSPDTDVRVL